MNQDSHRYTFPQLAGILISLMLFSSSASYSQDEALAKASQNPIANMISLPFQNNLNWEVGPKGGEQNILNVQPVYPIQISENVNLITRTIVPLVSQAALVPGTGSVTGIGDVSFTGFFSPANGGDVTWGIGPVLTFPTATDPLLGTRRWGAGPSIVVVAMPGKWVLGGLVSNVWDYAGWGDADINLFTFQPFINYNMDGGWYLTTAPIINANWEKDSKNTWTIPLGGGVGRVFKMGNQPVNMQLSAYYNVERPEFAPEWQLRIQMTLLFPK